MADESVVYVHSIVCPSCGHRSAGYMQVMDGGKLASKCERCGTTITQLLPEDSIQQLPPAAFVSPVHPHVHVRHYPDLYVQPKHAPRFDFVDLARIGFAPRNAFPSLYLSTNLHRALAIVVMFSLLSALISALVTADVGEVLGYSTADALAVAMQGFIGWAVSILAFLVFALTSASVARGVFGGRGEKSSTIMLIGYAYPAYVLLSILLLLIFTVGFGTLDLTDVQNWTGSALNQAIFWGTVLLLVALVGLMWLLWVVSRAISVANDISMGEAALSAMLSAIAAGIVYVLAGLLMRLPMGLFL